MKAKSRENIVFVRRTGRLGLRAAFCLLSGALVSFAVFAVRAKAGWVSSTPIAIAAGLAAAFYLFAKTLPESTLFDLDARVVRIGGSGPIGTKAEIIPFRDIFDIRSVTKGAASGYCLRLRENPLFDCRIIGNVTPEDAYAREFRLQALPKIERALSEAGAGAHMPPQPDGDLACFERKPGGWERKLPLSLRGASLSCAIFAARTSRSARFFPFPRRPEAVAVPRGDRVGCGFLPDRRHVVDPAGRTLTIFLGLFSLKAEVFGFDDLESVPVRLHSGKRASVYLRFRGDRRLRFLASGGPDDLRKITACYALAMKLDLAGKIEYLA